jgi:hypothetical protein
VRLDFHVAIADQQSWCRKLLVSINTSYLCSSTPTTAVLPDGGDFSATLALTSRGHGQQEGPLGAMRELLAPFRDRQLQSARFLMTNPTHTNTHCKRTRTDPMGVVRDSEQAKSRAATARMASMQTSVQPDRARPTRRDASRKLNRFVPLWHQYGSDTDKLGQLSRSRLKCMGYAMNMMQLELPLPSLAPPERNSQIWASVPMLGHARDRVFARIRWFDDRQKYPPHPRAQGLLFPPV